MTKRTDDEFLPVFEEAKRLVNGSTGSATKNKDPIYMIAKVAFGIGRRLGSKEGAEFALRYPSLVKTNLGKEGGQ